MNTTSCTKLMSWNANGLANRRIELEYFLHTRDIDIGLISETHSISYTNPPKIHNYTVFLANHPSHTARGGSAIIIKSSICHHDIGAFITEGIQASVVAKVLNHHQVNIASIYCPL